MANGRIPTRQVVAWAWGHAPLIFSMIGILYGGFLLWQKFDAHISEGAGRDKQIIRLEQKVDQLQDTTNRILLILARRK